MSTEDNYKKIKDSMGCLSHYACTTANRDTFQTPRASQLLDEFIRDETKILQSRAFRRLARKAQIMTQPANINVRNRLTHTMEVTSIAIRIAYYLGLNVNLTRAIGLGHDLGHVPFGHQGERYLSQRGYEKFNHRIMAILLLRDIERDGHGLNLSREVLDGIYYHSGPSVEESKTLEAKVVHYADTIANTFADVNDFVRFGIEIDKETQDLFNEFGPKQRNRVDTAVAGLCEESRLLQKISFKETPLAQKFFSLECKMYDIYPTITPQDVSSLFDPIYEYFEKSTNIDPVLGIAMMTDDDILNFKGDIRDTSLGEIVDLLSNIELDFDNLDL